MTDQTPGSDPYDVGDRVRIRLVSDEAENPYEGAICRVVHVFVDRPEDGLDPDTVPERETDRAAYRLEDEGGGEVLPMVVRHRDLVPIDEAS